ncbi:hypothetical protein [Spiroplasma sp. SV19]|uniref:hypothetical protein n=1 Tax=Spiroplasma sp. SV19 TaxID=2570468 RepID=UPI0024B6DD00|nr:hypothetical protein [Spiroplasma sp. SV19]WHQ37489.1 hypothetical protein E7Y35_06555 [Spiroplasma sp. SV19]
MSVTTIAGIDFYERFLSIPRTKAIHDATIDENFQNEIINKNKIDDWINSVKDFIKKIEEYVLKIIES